MASPIMAWLPGLLVLSIAASLAAAETFVYDFQNLDGWTSYKQEWEQAWRWEMTNSVPSGSIDDAFVVMSSNSNADKLVSPKFDAPDGGLLTFVFFLRSPTEGGNDLYVDVVDSSSYNPLLELASYSSPNSDSWVTVTAEIPPGQSQAELEIMCYNEAVAPEGDLIYGCVIDQIEIEIYGDTTTPLATTEGPSGPLEYDFQTSTQGWSLSQTNGAAWKRVQFDNTGLSVSSPPEGPWVLQAVSTDVFAGATIAQSPKLQATADSLTVSVTFWMDGDRDLPAQLKVRRMSTYNEFDEDPIVNLDPYGDQTNYYWVTFTRTLYNMVPGETFTITLEGCLGSFPNNSVAVNKVVIDGAQEVPTDASNIIDFEDGLFGWSMGNMDGGRWVLQRWSELDPSLNVPQPSDGENFLMVKRFDIHSGVITIESPSFPVAAGELKKVHVKFWLRGSVAYPAALRLRKKTTNGQYDALPFLNLAPYGDIDHPDWLFLDQQYYIPVDEAEESFQLVIEADLGSDAGNMVAVDNLSIITELAKN